MADLVTERRGVPVLLCAADGPPVAGAADAVDLIGASFDRADVIAVPVERLHPDFFALRTGVAGDIVQKFVNYRKQLAVVGDISAAVAGSTALRDLVTESGRGGSGGVWFVADLTELDERLA
ncbi:hypothetical protein GCM10010123_06090 [Pilimelia anulata]|uniref:DUF4180 domain-containing protein n=1 Tax=Pilimelia anulata TaxID=53371 RepID=A0A8J3B006_9ACTN|nr:DUF4180 domain-containing protein [Pilimelia anulata]GGJ78956.1 hypothetical protein GCM10010123_06090 [Pilimelia anulata]